VCRIFLLFVISSSLGMQTCPALSQPTSTRRLGQAGFYKWKVSGYLMARIDDSRLLFLLLHPHTAQHHQTGHLDKGARQAG
jgi:hypothetical protein